MFARWGRFVHRHRGPTLVFAILWLAGSIFALAQGGTLENAGIISTSESGRAVTLIREELPRATGSSFTVIFSSDTLRVDTPAFRAALEDALKSLEGDERITSIRTPYEMTPINPAFVSEDGRRAFAVVAVRDSVSAALAYYPELRERISSTSLEITASGNIAITEDFDKILESDLQRAEFVSLPVAMVLLLVVFGTVIAAALPLGIGVLTVVGGLAGVFLLARVDEVSQYALNIVTLIGLGLSIDYSLFIVNRFREELAGGAKVESAISRAMATAGRAITFSGITVAIGLSGMLFYQGTFLASMGKAGAIVVALAILYALTALPALLSFLGPRVNSWALPSRRRAVAGRGFWHTVSMGVMRRPLLVLVPVLAVILVTAAPFLQLRMANGDVTMLPTTAESRRGYDLLLSEFPGQDKNQISVVVQFADSEPLAPSNLAQLVSFAQRIEQVPDVLRIESPFTIDAATLGRTLTPADYQALYAAPRETLAPALRMALEQSVGERIAVLSVLTAAPKTSEEAQALVRAIRELPEPSGADVLVTGLTAFDIDVVNLIVSRTPAAVAWIVLATYVVLFLLLGSVVLPLKAVIMNLLSISTSFGALVFVFQQGHFAEQLRFTAAPLDPTLPVILFCIVFGLSMDYEVLLLSRIQEEYRKTGDNTHSVAEGLERSGRLITGAAAIMIGVFVAFGLAEVVIIKAIGLGMALAVAIDATLVRALVVPATMRLLGDLNWWAPRPLARLYRRLGLGEAPA